jgi:hypothetical protein
VHGTFNPVLIGFCHVLQGEAEIACCDGREQGSGDYRDRSAGSPFGIGRVLLDQLGDQVEVGFARASAADQDLDRIARAQDDDRRAVGYRLATGSAGDVGKDVPQRGQLGSVAPVKQDRDGVGCDISAGGASRGDGVVSCRVQRCRRDTHTD